MLTRINRAMQEKDRDKGFTLIELLVVIIIIGILAAIAIPAFLNQRQKGWAAQVESDLKNAAIAAESYAVDNNGSYVGTPPLEATVAAPAGTTVSTVWDANGFNSTDGVGITFAATGSPAGSSFTLTGTHASRSGTWVYDSTTGVITLTS